MPHRFNQSETIKARNLRKSSTDAELFLWKHLRSRQLGKFKFRRQEPIGHFIVDFVCLDKKLVIEVDGSQHINNKKYDAERSEYLKNLGFIILRFWNNDVLNNIEGVLEVIGNFRFPHPSPLPTGEGTRRGFTLMELVLVIAILGIIAGLGIGNYANFLRQGSLDGAANEIVAALRKAQTNSQASSDGYGWAVHFDDMNQGADANRYIIYRGECSNDMTKVCRVDGQCTNPGTCQNTNEEIIFTNSAVEISSVTSVNSYPDVIFTRPTGKPQQNFDITIQLKGGAQQKIINVSALGKIE